MVSQITTPRPAFSRRD